MCKGWVAWVFVWEASFLSLRSWHLAALMPKQLHGDYMMHTLQAVQTCHNRNKLSFGSSVLIGPIQQFPGGRSVACHQYKATILHKHANMPSQTEGWVLSHCEEKESTPWMLALHTVGVASVTTVRNSSSDELRWSGRRWKSVRECRVVEDVGLSLCASPLQILVLGFQRTEFPTVSRGREGDGGVRGKYSMRYSNWGVAPSVCRGYILWQRVRRIIWKEQEGDRGNYKGQGGWQRIAERNRIKLLMTDQWCHHKRLTIIRTKARGNIPEWKEIVAEDKGEHSYYKRKGRALRGVVETITRRRSNKGPRSLRKSFYRGTGFCGVMGSWQYPPLRAWTLEGHCARGRNVDGVLLLFARLGKRVWIGVRIVPRRA